jgi:hypothetical protein
MARAGRKSPSEFPEAKCPHGNNVPWVVIGRHEAMLRILHDKLDVGGPANRELADLIRGHILRTNDLIDAGNAQRADNAARVA